MEIAKGVYLDKERLTEISRRACERFEVNSSNLKKSLASVEFV